MKEQSFRALMENDKEGRRINWDESGGREISDHSYLDKCAFEVNENS